MESLIAVHLAALPHLVPVRRQPPVHLVGVRAIPLRLGQPFVETEEGGLRAVSHLEIHPSAPVSLLNYRRPHPTLPAVIPTPCPGVRPHLIKGYDLGQRPPTAAVLALLARVRNRFRAWQAFLTHKYTVPAFIPSIRLMASMLLPSAYMATAMFFTRSG